MYFTYIIQSTKNNSWYYGSTDNLDRRVNEHNTGQNKSTKNKGPWKLIFKRPFETRLEAVRFEMKLKKLRNKKFIKKEYSIFFI